VSKPDLKPSFEVIVSTYATQAEVALGQLENPITKKKDKDLHQAKFAIDLLQILDEKTKGNRTSDEDKFLADCLYQLRMVYLSLSK